MKKSHKPVAIHKENLSKILKSENKEDRFSDKKRKQKEAKFHTVGGH